MAISRSQAFSLGMHVLLICLLLVSSQAVRPPKRVDTPPHATPLVFQMPRKEPKPRGGGSNRFALPAKHGAPPMIAHRTFIPPTSAEHPALSLPITIDFDIPIATSAPNIGDPFSNLTNGAFGMHGSNGIGDSGCCGGIGNSQSGPPGISVISTLRGATPPQLIYKVEPEFSEEARKAKHEGVVVLIIEVDSKGNVGSIRVLRALGLGLDEKAVEAVSQWRFRPGILDGKPVNTEATVQVTFQLL
jgi:periplasmic protein TonB